MKKILLILTVISSMGVVSVPVRSLVACKNIAIEELTELPYDAQIEYAHFPSGAYIDTGMYICTAFGLQFSFRINNLVGSYDTYFGAYNGGNLIGFRRSGKTSNLEISGYGVTFDPTAIIGVDSILEVSPKDKTYQTIYWDGVSQVHIARVNYTIYPLTLFIGAAHYSSPSGYFATSDFNFFGFKLWDYRETPSLIMDLVPVRIGEEAFVFDKVSKQFFSSLGTAKLGLGPDKKR